jgi:hypothetical protein
MASSPTVPQAPMIGKPVSPKPPVVGSPKPPPVVEAPRAIEPADFSDSSWDDAPTATSMPDAPPAVTTKQASPPSVVVEEPDTQSQTNPTFTQPERVNTDPMPNRPVGNARPNPPPAAVAAGLGREEVWAIVRAAVENATAPLLAKQQDLEARLERVDQSVKAMSPRPPPVVQQQQPQQLQTAQAIPPATPTAPGLGQQGSSAAARLAAIAPATRPQGGGINPVSVLPVTPNVTRANDSSAPMPDFRPAMDSSPYSSTGRSLPPQGYGVMVVPPGPRPSIDLDSIAIGPDDYAGFDGGRKKKLVVRVVIVLMLVIIVGVVVSTILSYSGPSTVQ